MFNLQKTMSKLQLIASFMQRNKYLTSIADGFTSALPVFIIGAFSTLLANLPIDSYLAFIKGSGLQQAIALPANVTLKLMSIYVCFCIAYKLARALEHNAMVIGAIAIMCFMITCPVTTINGTEVMPFQFLGAGGLFVAIIVALLVNKIYSFVVDRDLTIKMGDNVPAAVSETFNGLIPAIINVIIFAIIAALFKLTSAGSLHAWIYHLIQQPLLGITGSYGGLLTIVIVSHVLWLFGIHGVMVTGTIWKPLYMAMDLENLTAFQNGESLPHIVGFAFWGVWVSIGGSGSTLALNFLMAFKARSEELKKLGRMALPTSFLRINEPIIFGIPIILNPLLAIPFVLVPVLNASIAYFLISAEIIPRMIGVFNAIGVPVIFNAFIQGGWMLVALQLFLIALNVIIYYPFFKKMDVNMNTQVEKT